MRSGVACLGDSTTIVSYLPEAQRWTSLLADRLGVTVENYGVNGAVSRSFTDGYANRSWVTSNARWFLIRFGLNDSDPAKWALLDPVETYTTNAQMAAAFSDSLNDLVNEIRALGDGAEPIFLTNPYVDYPTHYFWNRDPNIQFFDGTYDGFPTVLQIPIYERWYREVRSGNWDLRVRAEGAALDDSLDYLHEDDADATWWTDIHPNARGCAVTADEIADNFDRLVKRSVTGTAQQVGAIRTLIDGLRGYPLCECPTHGTNTEGALLIACPCTSRTVTNPACPYLTTHDARTESGVYKLSLRAEQEYIDARAAAIAAGGGGTALQLILAGCPDPA